jgi:hypothetical protein
VGVSVGVAVAVAVGVRVEVDVGVGVDVLVGVGVVSEPPTMPQPVIVEAATAEMAMNASDERRRRGTEPV